MKELPIGIQTLKDFKENNYVYVDKTEHIHNLVSKGKVYFLSRPRRFGKSLLINTLKELFKGNKELFEGLYIYDKWDWSKKNPVIHLDFTKIDYQSDKELKESLFGFISSTASNCGIQLSKSTLSSKFAELIEVLHKTTDKRVVVLIDEYDKPLIDNLVNKGIYSQVKRSLHDFYQVIKANDEHIQFVLLTGVSQFSGLSIFSGLNNLYNMTMSPEFSSICGYTQEELENNFKEHIEETAKEMAITREELLAKIKYWYNGYSWEGKVFVYNPFSTLVFFRDKEFREYWFETGTPTFLIEQVGKMKEIESLVEPQKVSANVLKGPDVDKMEPISLMFQTGYLTIKKKETVQDESVYTVDFSNNEVKKAFLTRLVAVCARKTQKDTEKIRNKIYAAMEEKDAIKLQEGLSELFAGIPYDLHVSKEKYYHSMFLLAMRFVGYDTEGEVHTNIGRIDAVLRNEGKLVVVEVKYSKKEEIEKILKEAMNQIKEKKYYEKYKSEEVTLLGVAFKEGKEIMCRFES